MTTGTAQIVDRIAEQQDSFAERLLGTMAHLYDATSVYLGVRLGLYEALIRLGEGTSEQIAEAAGGDRRYVREWIEHQVANRLIL